MRRPPAARLLMRHSSRHAVTTGSGVEELRLSEWVRRGGGKLEPSCKRPVHGRRRRPGRSIGGHHVRGRISGCHRSSAVTRSDAGSLAGVRAAKQGAAVPGRSADGRGDHPRHAPSRARAYAVRTRGLIAMLWRAGLRISEALTLTESDLDPKTGSVLVRQGKGGKRRTVGMDDWAWEHVARWTEHRVHLPIGPLFCILAGPTGGRGWSATAARGELRRLAAQAGVRRRSAPHQLRHAHAIEMAHEGIPLPIIQRQLGHAHLGITSIYLQGSTRERSWTPSITAGRQ